MSLEALKYPPIFTEAESLLPNFPELLTKQDEFLEKRPLLEAYNRGNASELHSKLRSEIEEVAEELKTPNSLELGKEMGDVLVVWMSLHLLFGQESFVEDYGPTREQFLGLCIGAMHPDDDQLGFDLVEATKQVIEGKNGDHLPVELLQIEEGDLDEQGKITEKGKQRFEVTLTTLRHLRDSFDQKTGVLPKAWKIQHAQEVSLIVWRDEVQEVVQAKEVALSPEQLAILRPRMVDLTGMETVIEPGQRSV